MQTLFEPEGDSHKLHDVTTVGEAVQEGCGKPGVTEDFRPAGEVQVGGYQHRATFVPVGKKAEKQLSACLGEGNESDLIQDEQVQLPQSSFQLT